MHTYAHIYIYTCITIDHVKLAHLEVRNLDFGVNQERARSPSELYSTNVPRGFFSTVVDICIVTFKYNRHSTEEHMYR